MEGSRDSARDVPRVTAQTLLDEVREAWRIKCAAEGVLARLRRYRAQTPGMKHDRERALARIRDADETIRRILGERSNEGEGSLN